jgi:hypothetical protein
MAGRSVGSTAARFASCFAAYLPRHPRRGVRASILTFSQDAKISSLTQSRGKCIRPHPRLRCAHQYDNPDPPTPGGHLILSAPPTSRGSGVHFRSISQARRPILSTNLQDLSFFGTPENCPIHTTGEIAVFVCCDEFRGRIPFGTDYKAFAGESPLIRHSSVAPPNASTFSTSKA